MRLRTRSNHALQRTAAGRCRCNRRASWPPSLSLGRWACHCFEIAGLPRRTYFWTLPVAVFGSSDTNWIRWGHLKCAR
jgi:hypothetical protein